MIDQDMRNSNKICKYDENISRNFYKLDLAIWKWKNT